MIISIPEKLKEDNLNQRMDDLEKAFDAGQKQKNVIFDLTTCKHLSPTAINYLSLWRDVFKGKNIETFARLSNNALARFISGMQFIDVPNVSKSIYEKYMIKLHRCSCVKECTEVQKEIVEMIVMKSELPKESIAAVDYTLNEIWDNAGVHGYKCYASSDYPKPVYICGFNYKTHIEVSIADSGQGIHNSLTGIEEYSSLTPEESVRTAIIRGSSGHPAGSPGFGLYCSSEFMKRGNCSFSIWSSGVKLQICNGEEKIYKSRFNHGTIISLIVKKNTYIPFSEILGNRDVNDYFETMIEGSIL